MVKRDWSRVSPGWLGWIKHNLEVGRSSRVVAPDAFETKAAPYCGSSNTLCAGFRLAACPNRRSLFNKRARALAKVLRLLEPFLRFIAQASEGRVVEIRRQLGDA
jgi:hypothetical protein